MTQRRNTFTAAQINRLRQLFMEKDMAGSDKKKRIRDKMRDMGFYISDFRNSMDSDDFEQLLTNGEIKTSDGSEEVSLSAEKEVQNENDFKKGLAPWIDERSEILILGSLPGDTSIKRQAYYQNKSNCFWKLMHGIFGDGPDAKEFLLQHHIALWDCLAAANRVGSLDANFTDGETPNDIPGLLTTHPNVRKIVLNGVSKTKMYFDKYFKTLYQQKIEIVAVNSSSNTNSNKSFEEKLQEWKDRILS